MTVDQRDEGDRDVEMVPGLAADRVEHWIRTRQSSGFFEDPESLLLMVGRARHVRPFACWPVHVAMTCWGASVSLCRRGASRAMPGGRQQGGRGSARSQRGVADDLARVGGVQ